MPATSRSRLAAGVKFRLDAVRGMWVLLAPERLFQPDETAVEVLKLIDGERSLRAITDALAARYQAPHAVIAKDVADCTAGSQRARSPAVVAAIRPSPPLALLAELTHRCPLTCFYCSNPLELERRSTNWTPRPGNGC